MKKEFIVSFLIKSTTALVLIYIFLPPAHAQPAGDNSLETLFNDFKLAAKPVCGKRGAAIPLGKKIVDLYANDELNKEIIEWVKKKVATIEKEDRICLRNNGYDINYKNKNWRAFFVSSKAVIADEGDSPLSLDVILTLVSVGFNRAADDNDDSFNEDTIHYARLAMQKIEAGQTSKTGKWGVFEPFSTKENSVSWMNYITGWILYEKLNQKKEALPYLYKAARIGSEKQNDASLFIKIGTVYHNEAVRLYAEYAANLKAGKNKETKETRAILALARGTADRAVDAFGRADKIVRANPQAQPETKEAISKTLTELYKFRFNRSTVQPEVVDKYVAETVAKPMPDPASPIEPVKIKNRNWLIRVLKRLFGSGSD